MYIQPEIQLIIMDNYNSNTFVSFLDFDLMDDRKYDLVQLFVEKELRRDICKILFRNKILNVFLVFFITS